MATLPAIILPEAAHQSQGCHPTTVALTCSKRELLWGYRSVGAYPHLSKLPPWEALLSFPPLPLSFCKIPMVSWLHTLWREPCPISVSGVFGIGQRYQPTNWRALLIGTQGLGGRGALTSRVSPVFKFMLFASTLWNIDTGSSVTRLVFT